MNTFSKSPVRVARRALAAGQKMLRPYARPRSPKKYTQPQLFACLVLKTFAKTDYRGIAQLLADLSDLRRVLGLCGAPPWTTLHSICLARNLRWTASPGGWEVVLGRAGTRWAAVRAG